MFWTSIRPVRCECGGASALQRPELCQMNGTTQNDLERPGTSWDDLGSFYCIQVYTSALNHRHRTIYFRFVVPRQENDSVMSTSPDCWHSKSERPVTSTSSMNSSESRRHALRIIKVYAHCWSLGPFSSNYIKTASPASPGEVPRPRAELTLINVYLVVRSGSEMLDIQNLLKAW